MGCSSGAICGVVSLVVVLALSHRAGVTTEEREYRLSLHCTPDSERDASLVRATRWATLLLAAFGVGVAILFLTHYVLPYQRLTGTLRDGGLDWMTGETFHALGWALLFVFVGGLAYRVVRGSYAARRPD